VFSVYIEQRMRTLGAASLRMQSRPQ